MALEKAELQPSSSWFLTARGGDVRLRVRDEIRIGEDDSGDLILNPPLEMALVVCSVSPGRLNLRCVQPEFRIGRRDGSRHAELDIQPGQALKLALPHNNVLISPEASSGRIRTEPLTLLQADSAAPIQAPRRNSSAVQRQPADPIDAITEAGDTASIPTLTLLQRVDTSSSRPVQNRLPLDDAAASTHSDLLAPILVAEAPAVHTMPEAAGTELRSLLHPVRSLGGSSVPLLVLCLLSLVLVAADETTPLNPSVAENSASAAPPAGRELILLASNASSVTSPTETQAALTRASTDQQAEPSPAPTEINPDEPVSAADADAEPPDTTGASEPVVAEVYVGELARARRLFNAGKIITPLDNNAVRALRWILSGSPEYAEAQLLLDQCAERLLSQAGDAYAAGDDYQARNLVEEILAFNPQYAPAEEFWDELTAAE